MANLLMVFSWGLFYFLHTALAATKLKRILKEKWHTAYKWYRLFYSVLSLILFSGILIQAMFLPLERVFISSSFSQYSGYLIATAGVIIGMRSLKQISLFSFLGLSANSSEESDPELAVSGMYSQIRHPLYFGLLAIFLGYFLVSGTMGALIHLACLVVYLPIGIYFEEKNMISIHGNDYKKYQENVPAFFPRIHKKRG